MLHLLPIFFLLTSLHLVCTKWNLYLPSDLLSPILVWCGEAMYCLYGKTFDFVPLSYFSFQHPVWFFHFSSSCQLLGNFSVSHHHHLTSFVCEFNGLTRAYKMEGCTRCQPPSTYCKELSTKGKQPRKSCQNWHQNRTRFCDALDHVIPSTHASMAKRC